MLAVLVAWVFFRATSVAEALEMLRAMAGHVPSTDLLAGRQTRWMVLMPLMAFAVALPNSQSVIMARMKPAIERSIARGGGAVWAAMGVGVGLIAWLALVAASRENSAFIYLNF